MKKIVSVFIAAALALSLCACDKSDSRAENSSAISDASGSAEQSAPVGNGESSVPPASPVSTVLTELTSTANVYFDVAACGVDNGLYYIEPGRIGKSGGYLMYIDYASKQEVYVCSDSACKHDTERCTGYFSSDDFILDSSSRLFAYNGSLFFLSIAHGGGRGVSSSPQDYRGGNGQALYRMNFDGTDRQRVFTFDNELEIEPFAAGDGDSLWFCVKTPVLGYNEEFKCYYHDSKDRALIRVSLSDYNILERIPLRNDSGIGLPDIVGCSDNEFVFSAKEYPKGVTREDEFELFMKRDPSLPFDQLTEEDKQMNEIDKNSYWVYFTLDRTDKEFKEIYRVPYLSSVKTSLFNNDMYIYDNIENSTAIINTANGEKEEYANFSPIEGYEISGMFGGRYVCRSGDIYDGKVYFIDPETKEIGSTELKSPGDPQLGIMFSAVAADDEYVLIRGEAIEIPNRHYGVAGYYYNYYVMPIGDFFNGTDSMEPVKIIERDKVL